jgi:hypothetical protein
MFGLLSVRLLLIAELASGSAELERTIHRELRRLLTRGNNANEQVWLMKQSKSVFLRISKMTDMSLEDRSKFVLISSSTNFSRYKREQGTIIRAV